MKLPGVVTNITNFGVFVDIGVHQDGLVHISELSNRFIKNPADVVKVQQKVRVTVLEVDLERKRIALSMRDQQAPVAKLPETPRGKKGADPSRKRPEKFSNNPFFEAFKGKIERT